MSLPDGTLLQGGKYRIERTLGQGGFGITYLVEQTTLGMRMAMKEFFMKEHCSRDEHSRTVSVSLPSNVELVEKCRRKFKKETQALAHISNPHVVRIHDTFTENNTDYYVMDYIDGESLSVMLKREGPLPETAVRRYLTDILDALSVVHAKGLLHLDLKPANIMVDHQSGHAILIDFGASKQIEYVDGQSLSLSSALAYTPGYAPIEQTEQATKKFGPWTDIYSLGATLYHLLSGQRPPLSSEIAEEGLPLLPTTVSAAMRNTITCCLRTTRTQRPQCVDDVALLLQEKRESDGDRDDTLLKEKERQASEEAERKAREEAERKAREKAERRKREKADAERKAREEAERKAAEQAARRKKMKSIALWSSLTVVAVVIALVLALREPTSQVPELPTSVEGKTIVLTSGPESKRNFVYTGEVDANGLPNGSGTAKYPETKSSSSATFTGTFAAGITAEGELIFSSGMKYKGTFTADGYYDRGTLTDKDGYYYKGTFKGGKPYNGTWYTPGGKEDSKVVNGQ